MGDAINLLQSARWSPNSESNGMGILGGVQRMQTPKFNDNLNPVPQFMADQKMANIDPITGDYTQLQDSVGFLGKDTGPSPVGQWLDKWGGTAMGVGKIGLGIFNAMNMRQANKDTARFYEQQNKRANEELAISKKMANQEIDLRAQRLAGAQTDTSKASKDQFRADYMKQWGV